MKSHVLDSMLLQGVCHASRAWSLAKLSSFKLGYVLEVSCPEIDQRFFVSRKFLKDIFDGALLVGEFLILEWTDIQDAQ